MKVVDEDSNKGEWLKSGDYPLSPADWVMLLSGGVSDRRTNLLTFGVAILAVLLVCLSSIITLLGGGFLERIASYILDIFAFVLLIVLILHVRHVNQKIKPREKIIKDIIYEKLKNHEDILKRCEEVGIFKHIKD